MSFDLLLSLGKTIKTPLLSRTLAALSLAILTGYVALGFRTQFMFPFVLPAMYDFNIYLRAVAVALKGKNPYAYTDIWTAYLYPLPGLLIPGLVSLIRDDILHASAYMATNIFLLGVMLKGIAKHYGYNLEQIWWWFPLAFGFAPLLEMLYVGQINIITSFGVYLLFFYSEPLPALAGFGLALAALTKITPGLFLILPVIQRHFRTVFWFFASVVFAYAVSFLLFGWQPPETFLTVLGNLSQRYSPGPNSMALVTSLVTLHWAEQGAWPAIQRVVIAWTAIAFVASGICAWLSKEHNPLFIVMGLGIAVASNVMWYHHFVFILVPLFAWMAWSRLHPGVIAWCFLGLVLIQLDRWYWTQGLLPHLFVQASILSLVAWQLAKVARSVERGWLFVGGGSLASMAILIWLTLAAIGANRNLATAKQWIDEHVPAGAHIALETNGPDIDRLNHNVQVFDDLLAHSPEWYAKNGWQYLVTGHWTPGLLNQLPILSSSTGNRYKDFSSAFSPFGHVAEGGDEIWVFKTGALLPERRVYARWGGWGVDGDWIELVGFDSPQRGVSPGELLTVTLYWRSIQRRRDRLELTLHLLDSQDREVWVSSQALFPQVDTSGVWPEGITPVPIQVNVPAVASPGSYRIELDVDAPGTLGIGRLPVLSRDQKPISDKQYIGPFKVAPPMPREVNTGLQEIAASFGDTIRLRSFAFGRGPLQPGQSLKIEMLWQSLAATSRDYTVFIHLLDRQGNIRAQLDTQPFGGNYPTSLWDPGSMFQETYALPLPRNLPPGSYQIQFRLYDYPNLERLSITSAGGKGPDDHLTLPGALEIVSP
jgi:hypothetical protein